jgi:hypothetical protein
MIARVACPGSAVIEGGFVMLPGPNLIRQCGHCQKPFAQPTLRSGNTIGATFWTDGKREAPMLPETPWLVKCPHCGHVLWLDEATELGKEDPFVRTSRWPDAREYAEPTEPDYLAAVETPLADLPEKVRYIRMRAWWAANDRLRRDGDQGTAELPEGARRNMESLLSGLSEADEQQRLMRAELARELGRFGEAERLLAMSYADGLQHAVRRISELVGERKTRVATL